VHDLVFSADDAPQLANLPDLGPALRDCLMKKKCNGNSLVHHLQGCLPVAKSACKAPPVDQPSCCIMLHVLLATLLGLYPNCVKKPPFAVRARIFARVHGLLTACADAQAAFAAQHRPLLVFALAEYTCRLIPVYFPAEHESMCSNQAVLAYFEQGPAIFDAFRQECVDDGMEPWAKLAASAQEAHEKLSRTYRSKCRLSQQLKKPPHCETSIEALRAALECQRMVSYGCHWSNESLMSTEYAALLSEKGLERDVAAIHSLVKVAELPGSIKSMQVSLVLLYADQGQMCYDVGVAKSHGGVKNVQILHLFFKKKILLSHLLSFKIFEPLVQLLHRMPVLDTV